MKNKNHLLIYIIASGFLFVVDQLLKYLARGNQDFTYYLWRPWLGWEYFANAGIAFSLPFPNWLIIILTPFIILGLIIWYIKTYKLQVTSYRALAISLIIFGALSNFIDRIFFGATIDYLRILTGVINLADVMIAGGVLLIFIYSKRGYNETK